MAHKIIRAKSGTPALLDHRRPSTFSAACLSCGRTILVVFALASLVVLSSGNALAQTPPAISIEAVTSPVTEGSAATFTLSRTGDAAEALTVTVEVQQEFAVTVSRVPDKLFGEPPTTVTFDAGHATASLSLPTVDDALPDHDVVVTVAIGAGPDYSPGPSAATATVLVRENDPLIVRPVFTVLEGPDAGNPVPPDFANGLAEGTTLAVGISTETNGLIGGSVTFEIRLVEGTATDPEDVSLPFGSITSYRALLRRTSIITEGNFRQRPDGTFFQKNTARIVVSINNDGITEPNETFSIQVVPVSAEWPATVESSTTAILRAVIGDTTLPSLVTPDAATVDGTTLTVTFDEALDPASVPPGSAFTVTVGGTAVALASTDPVAVRGRTVTLTLASAVPPGDTVTVSYTVPTGGGARPVQDAVGNDAVGFSDVAVTNATRAHYAQGFTTGTNAPGYALTSVGLDFTSPFAPVVEVWAGDLAIQEDGGLTVLTEMEPLGVLTIPTHGRGDLVSGSVKVLSDGPIGGMLRFDLPAVGETVVVASLPISDAIFPVRRQEGGITTGVAIHNLESSPGLVRCDLLREGVLRDAASFPLEANGQSSWLIDQAFPGTDTSDFVGSVRCDAVGEGRFSAVALEMDPVTRIFTTLPVFPIPQRISRE